MSDIALRQRIRAAEESAEDWRRRAEHAEAQIKLAAELQRQAEQTTNWAVAEIAMLRTQRCDCERCEHRERGMG